MRTSSLSTALKKSNLGLIYSYGVQAGQNRWRPLVIITLVFILAPRLIAYGLWQKASFLAVNQLSSLEKSSALQILEQTFSSVQRGVVFPTLFLGFFPVIGVLAMAKSLHDYFASRPSTFNEVVKGAIKTLFKKGFGVLMALAVVTPVLTLMPLLRTVGVSLLVMLPLTLVATTHGGFKTTMQTVFLKYAQRSNPRRWPVFLTVMTVTGLALSVFFGVSLLIENLAFADVTFGWPSGLWGQLVTVGFIPVNIGQFTAGITQIIWESLWAITVLPFLASTYHAATTP